MPDPQRPARIGFLLAQLGAHAADVFAELVRPLGITPSEAGVIRILGRSPGITQRQLADRLGAVQSRVVALIDALAAKGIAVRTRSTVDRRMQQLDLTPTGRRLLADLRGAAESQERAIVGALTERQRSELYGLLATVSRECGLDADVHPGYHHQAPQSDTRTDTLAPHTERPAPGGQIRSKAAAQPRQSEPESHPTRDRSIINV